uniref:Reverse transcriptase domain-containing protein n=1 Tax=Tanacetum cinerariifolium TaxID=118510 RepID=A0A699H2Y9_TANCI|nr:hypothetical protein [Tanacetum cinerariifolium]
MINQIQIEDYQNERIDFHYRRECEIKIDELREIFNGMSIEINKKKELQQLEQAANLSTYSPELARRFNYFCYNDDDYEESTIPLNKIISQIPSSIVITSSPPVLPTKDSEDSLIMGDKDLSTILEKESNEVIKSSVEDLIPIPSEFEDTSRSDSECDLPSFNDFSPINILEGKSVTFSNPLFDSNDDFTSSDYESLSDKDVLEDKVKMYLNPLFEFDDEYISSDVNPLFDEDGYYDSEGDIIYLKNLLTYDTIPSLLSEMFLDHDPKGLKDEPNDDDLKYMVKIFNLGIHEKFFSPTYVSLPFENRHYLFITYVI